MSGSYFARFVVKHTDNSDSYLRQAYRNIYLHTDGTYVDEPTDWLMMMKIAERHAEGGESRLLHLDDWNDLGPVPSASPGRPQLRLQGAPVEERREELIRRPIFHRDSSGVGISYIDQFAQPETIEQARYLFDLSQSLENSPAIKTPRLSVGHADHAEQPRLALRPRLLPPERAAASRADAAARRVCAGHDVIGRYVAVTVQGEPDVHSLWG